MSRFRKFKLNKSKIENTINNNIEKIREYNDPPFKVKIENEERLLDESTNPYISIDFTFWGKPVIGFYNTSIIYNFIAEYANEHSINIVSVSNFNKDSEGNNLGSLSVIFEKTV